MGFPAFLVLCNEPHVALKIFMECLWREAAGVRMDDLKAQLLAQLGLEREEEGECCEEAQ